MTFAVCLSCWIAGYLFSAGFPLEVGDVVLPLWGVLCKLSGNKLLAYIIGFVAVVLVAFVIQRISDREVLISERTRLPFVLFVLLVSTNPGLLSLRAITIVLLLLVFMVFELFNSYQSPESTGKLFNAGVLIGASVLLVPQIFWLVPVLWIGMYQFRCLNLKSLAATVIGIMIVYWFVLAWCVYIDDFSMFTSLYLSITGFNIISISLLQPYHTGLVAVVLLLIMAYVYIKSDTLSNSVRVRMMLSFLLNMAVWLVILMLLFSNEIDMFFAVLCVPVSILSAYFFENIRYRYRFGLYYSMLVLWGVSFILRLWNF
jgi:hypothetical protein